jgi:hypothetical protein
MVALSRSSDRQLASRNIPFVGRGIAPERPKRGRGKSRRQVDKIGEGFSHSGMIRSPRPMCVCIVNEGFTASMSDLGATTREEGEINDM